MFRRRSSDKAKLEPELCVLLRYLSRYPGDTLQGVVIVDFPSPTDILTLEVRLSGEERTTLGTLLVTQKNPEARKTLYYEQFITLRGVDHEALEQRRGLLGRRRTVVNQEVALRKSSAATMLSNQNSNSNGGASSQDGPSTEDSVYNLTPSVINTAAGSVGTVHLVPGTYSFPFTVTLPDTLPQSRELRRAHEGCSILRYRAAATLILAGGKIYTAESPFRMNPMPVQVQRWYQLHGDEQNGADASETDDVGNTEGAPHSTLKSRLLSSPGAISADAADKEREVSCRRRIQHYRQFPEHQLIAERAEYEKLAEIRAAKKGEDGKSPSSPQTAQEMTAEKGDVRRSRPTTSRERRAKQNEADNRSLDGNDDNGDAASAASAAAGEKEEEEEEESDDEVHTFEVDGEATPSTTEKTTSGKSGDPHLAPNASADITSMKKKKKYHHHHHRSKDQAAPSSTAANKSALVENNVDQLAFTPPDVDLGPVPVHMAVRHSVVVDADVDADAEDATDAAAASPKTKASRRKSRDKKELNRGEGEKKKSQGTQMHRHHIRFVQPPWNQEFNIHLRSGLLRTGKVKVKLSLRSPLVSVGSGKVMVKLLVDNSEGSGNITRVKYSLITRCYMRSKAEVYNYHVDAVETITDVNIEKGNIVAVPEVEIPVPRSTPLTILTEGMGTLSFLNVRFYVVTALKTFSKSVETEVILVSGQDTQNKSRRLLRWTCFFRRRNSSDPCEVTVRPPTINLSERYAKVRVMQAAELVRPLPASSNGDVAEVSSLAPSAISRSLTIMRSSRRVAKDAPSLDARRLASVLNYDEAVFVPHTEDDSPGGPISHVDPMSMLNPFAMPPGDMGSALPSADRDDDQQK
ncbi:hypothetical protein N2W54_007439 [Lotmaria passim]